MRDILAEKADEIVRKLTKAFDEWDGSVVHGVPSEGNLVVKVVEHPSLAELLDKLQDLHDEGVVYLRGVDGP